MAKAKITMVVEVEYEIQPENYDEHDDTDEKRVAFDVNASKLDIGLILGDDSAKYTFKGELINE
jgi:hypothetical protein